LTEQDEIRHAAAGRLASEYLLRAADAVNMTLDGDLTMGLVFIGVVQANAALCARAARDHAHICKPVSGGALAASLRIPAETVRRKVKALIEAGYIRRERGGLVAPPEALRRPEIARVMRANYLNLRRLFRQLKKLGVDLGSAG
jgi:biotin operon repressor